MGFLEKFYKKSFNYFYFVVYSIMLKTEAELVGGEKVSDCIFCKIIAGEIPAKLIYEDESIIAFNDIDPQAPVHILIVPKKHITSLDECKDEDVMLLGELLNKVKVIAKNSGLENGYRLVNNCGEDGMQTVKHIHFHLLGARKMVWPPG